MVEHLSQQWEESRTELEGLDLNPEDEKNFYDQALMMVENFYQTHLSKLTAFQRRHNLSLKEALESLRPSTETRISSARLGLLGVIDAIHNLDGEIVIVDYKTSKKGEIDRDCLLQLALYALLYEDYFGRPPDRVGIHFLRHGEKLLPVTPELLELGRTKSLQVRNSTRTDDLTAYPQRPSGLCRYKSGQCDYYEICSEGKPHI